MSKQKIYMKPGKNNKEDRENFIKFWVDYIKTHEDRVWSNQQNLLINSQLKTASSKE